MIWLDMILNLSISDSELSKKIALLFSLQIENIKIIHSIEELGDDDATCLRSDLPEGDFNTMLTFYTSFAIEDSMVKVKNFSSFLGTTILVADDADPNPYSMILIAPGDKMSRVEVHPEKMDEENAYVITS